MEIAEQDISQSLEKISNCDNQSLLKDNNYDNLQLQEDNNNDKNLQNEQRNKREYNKLNPEILQIMNNYFQHVLFFINSYFEQKNYPTREEIKELSQKFKFSFVKVDNWFKHKRRQQAKKGLLAFLKRKTFSKSQNLLLLHCLQKCFQPNYNQYKQIGEFTKCDLKNVRNWFSYKRKQFYKFQRSKEDASKLEFKVIEEREQNSSVFQKQLEEFIVEQVPEKYKESFWNLPALLAQLKCFISNENKLEKISFENSSSNCQLPFIYQKQQQQQQQQAHVLQLQNLLQQKYSEAQQQQQLRNQQNFQQQLLPFYQQQQQIQRQNLLASSYQNFLYPNNYHNEAELNNKINYLQSQICSNFCQMSATQKLKDNLNQMNQINNLNNYFHLMQQQQLQQQQMFNLSLPNLNNSNLNQFYNCKQENDCNINIKQEQNQ